MISIRQVQIANTLCCVMSVASLIGPAQANDFCTDVNALIAQAEGGFALGFDAVASGAISGATDCGLSDNLDGARGFHCMWEYGYRQPEAYEAFASMTQSLNNCFGGKTKERRDQPVNHPDFYDQRLYSVGYSEVAVSIKDKAALRKTLVFFAVRSSLPG